MAFKLTSSEQKKRAELEDKLRKAREELNSALDAANEKLEEIRGQLQDAENAYNEVQVLARDFVEGIRDSRQDEYDNKSDKWRDSDKGSAASNWIDQWDPTDFEDISITQPDDVNLDYLEDRADTLAELPEAADEV